MENRLQNLHIAGFNCSGAVDVGAYHGEWSKGYRLYDFLPMYYHPLDNALWQGYAFFVRNDSKLISSMCWDK